MQKNILISVSSAIIIAIFIYIIYIIFPTVRGPQIILSRPENGEIIEGTYIDIKGQGVNLAKIFMNGTPLNLNKDGTFYTKFAIYEGHNILLLEGYDRYDRRVSLERILGTR